MMEVASPPTLARSFTTPVNGTLQQYPGIGGGATMSARTVNGYGAKEPSLLQQQSHTSSNYSIHTQASNRSSDTTQGTSQSTLFSNPPPLPANAGAIANGEVTASDNVMNTVADASSSLFQICITLRHRLMAVPRFAEHLVMEEEQADEDTDPVTVLWRTFSRGVPLMELYNALEPAKRLELGPSVRADKQGKAATFKFLQACVNDLKFPQEECFIVTDLYGDDTTGFVKVAKVVNRVLDILVQRGLIADVRPSAGDLEQAEQGLKRTNRQYIISELVSTERTYVQHLELLQRFKHLVEEKGIIPGDAVHDIFLNLNALLDTQRRFLIRVEQTNALPEEEQNWGRLFKLYHEAFKVYEPFLANASKCEARVTAEAAKLREAGGSPEMRQMGESPAQLLAFLTKPLQRLTKYPMLLDQLYRKGDLDEEKKADLLDGKEAAESVLKRANKAVDRQVKAQAVQELKGRVEDWKGHRVEGFGELLLYDNFTVLKSENLASGKDGERKYHVYLFETILLCCKDIDPSKPKNKLSNRPLVDKRGKPKLQLKGRIFMQNVTDLISLAKPPGSGPDDKGSYTCQIFWKGDPSIENFIIRFTNEETMKQWAQQIEAQRRRCRDSTSRIPRTSDGSGKHGTTGGTSDTDYLFMQQQPALENPYARMAQDEDDEDEDAGTLVNSAAPSTRTPSWETTTTLTSSSAYPNRTDFSQSRNGSQTSLRSRSTTGDSGGSVSGRTPAPRLAPGVLPPQQQPLTLRTQHLPPGAVSPLSGTQAQDSYFSPTGDSPLSSSRTSSSSGMYNFPRQPPNGYYEEDRQPQHGQSRFTAPAMPRGQQNAYAQNARQGGRTPVGGLHSSQQMPMPPRHRSASSPDIHNNAGRQQAGVSGNALRSAAGQPPVPDVPAGYHQYGAPRSQTNSPNLAAAPRGPTASPQLQRERTYPSTGARQHMDPSPISGYPHQQYPPPNPRAVTPASSIGNAGIQRGPGAFSPPPPSSTPGFMSPPEQPQQQQSQPSQLKVKVHCPMADQVLTLVVSTNITYQTLKDRIDAKLQRSTNMRLSDGGPRENQVKLKYLDEDDFVSIQSDEDVQTAFETWREQRGTEVTGINGMMGEIELYCQR